MPERTFAQWVARGMPRKGDGKRERYPWPEIYRWTAEQLERRGKESARPKDIDDARNRLMSADAELKELELAERRGHLMTVEQGEKWIVEAFGRIRGQLSAMEPRLAATLGACKTIPQRSKAIREAIQEVLEELYKGDDIPAPEDADG